MRRPNLTLAVVFSLAAASASAAERPDRPNFSALYASDGDKAAGFVVRDEVEGQRVLTSAVGCSYSTEDVVVNIIGSLFGPDSVSYTDKGLKIKQGAYLTVDLDYFSDTLNFNRDNIQVPSCKGSLQMTDKDGNGSFFDDVDQAGIKFSCGSDLASALGLDETQTTALLAVIGEKPGCKAKVIGGIDVGCFRGDTAVATPEGPRAIRDLRVGDKVWSIDEKTSKKVAARVSDTHVRPAAALRTIRAGEELLRTTDEHPFWVEGKGWTTAAQVAVGDKLRAASGDAVTVTANARSDGAAFYAGYEKPSVQRVSLSAFSADELVYNIEVEGTHSFLVGRSEVLVHNK
ncbi:MAG TPA: polymorphic toxin-type HINT domain-containing protein [Candidatus Binatia bacterium]|nr:polymorphic toxin-type HINT domain-containing protein [Candidatus Binatia bacterium]